jgi:predicted ATPase
MIKSIHFENFKALKNATLPLGRFTLLVGPNGSGKSTAMQAFAFVRSPGSFSFDNIVNAYAQNTKPVKVEVAMNVEMSNDAFIFRSGWTYDVGAASYYGPEQVTYRRTLIAKHRQATINELDNTRVFSFDAESIATSVQLRPNMALEPNGLNLVGVLDNLRDKNPERFEELNEELGRWLPEFDRILFETPGQGHRSFLLRTRIGHHAIRASDLSHGTLFALAFLTLAYIPNPPSIVCFEEPERGIHPRLLREIQDGMYRLAYPENYNEKRDPVQVIATTHSPYMLDLYKDHPEEIVIAHKDDDGVRFERLADQPNVDEFLQDAPLGEVWYSGILGGVPSRP